MSEFTILQREGTRMSIAKIFSKEFRKHVATFHPVWQPGDGVEVGAFGIIEDEVFVRQGHVSELFPKLKLEISSKRISGPMGFHSDQGFSSKASADGAMLLGPSAEATLSFSEAGGVFVRANDLMQNTLVNAYAVLKAIDARADAWPSSHALVWETQEAKEALVLISSSGNWQIKASGNAQAIAGLNLVKAGIELTTIQGQGYSRQLPAGDSLYPIALRLYGRRGFFKPSWGLMAADVDATAEVADDEWIEVEPDLA